jgi:hypothetical protein
MTIEEFAAFEGIFGQRIIAVNGTYWGQVRPLFYRPMLPYQEYQPGLVIPPSLSLLGGFQHAVPPEETSNSCLNLLMFEDAKAYSLDCLDYNRKRQTRLAAKQFVIQPITDINEFKQKAYPVYLSFYERTRYQYGSQRREEPCFSRWADALFRISNLVILGGYRNGELGGVSVSLLIEDTLCYATFFCNTASLRLGLSDLMLHFVREAVAEGQCAKQIFAGLYKGGKGLDDFYLLRGCKLVRKPALLHINPLAAFFLKRFLPEQYARLRGDIKDAQGGRAFEDGTPSQRPRIRAISEETKAVELGGSSRCDDRAESSGATGSNKGHSGRRTLAGMLLRDLHAIAN